MTNQYSGVYSKDSFWNKLNNYARIAGEELVRKACTLYFCFNDSDTPKKDKATILGALAYFISPIDAIPDITPFIGYSDDLGAIAAAIASRMTTAMMIVSGEGLPK